MSPLRKATRVNTSTLYIRTRDKQTSILWQLN